MGVRLAQTTMGSDADGAVILFDNVTEWAFGPLIKAAYNYGGCEKIELDAIETAEKFLEFLEDDARSYPDHHLEAKWQDFLTELPNGLNG